MENKEKQSYEIAQENAQSLFESLGLKCEISLPFPNVKDEWPSIGYNLTFSNNRTNVRFEYFLGIAHVEYNFLPNSIKMKKYYYMYESLFNGMKTGKTFKKGMGYEIIQSEIACELAKVQKVQPKPCEVLACICREGLEAIQSDFEEWSSNLGYDSDSKKAEKIYLQCREEYTKVLKLISSKDAETFAELACQF